VRCELAPIMGLADLIVDIVDTGNTLKRMVLRRESNRTISSTFGGEIKRFMKQSTLK